MKNIFHNKINQKHIFLLALLTIVQNISPITEQSAILAYKKEFAKLRTEYHLNNNCDKSDISFAKQLIACQNNSLTSTYCRDNEKAIGDAFFTHPSEKDLCFHETIDKIEELRTRFHDNNTTMNTKKSLIVELDFILLHASFSITEREKIINTFYDARTCNRIADIIELPDTPSILKTS